MNTIAAYWDALIYLLNIYFPYIIYVFLIAHTFFDISALIRSIDIVN